MEWSTREHVNMNIFNQIKKENLNGQPLLNLVLVQKLVCFAQFCCYLITNIVIPVFCFNLFHDQIFFLLYVKHDWN